LKVVYWPNASIEPTIAADTFLDVDVCAATELALAVAIATKLCAYTNIEVTSEDCPDGTIAQNPKITLVEGTIIDYDINADPTGTARTLANASRICTAITGDSDNPFEEDVTCGLKLTGAYTQEAGAPNINSIEWSVTSGNVKHENSEDTAAAYSGNTTSYDLYKPHFYASFAVDEAGFQISNTTITVEQWSTKTSTDFTILDTTGYLYIGSFVDFGPTVTNTTTGVTNGQIVVANAICAPDPYEYSLKQTQQFEGYPLT
jgi:hypothetical protein